MAQRIFASYIPSTKNPRVRPYFKNKKIYKPENFVYKARKHRAPPGTGTEPNGSSRLGAAPAPGTRQFWQVLLAVGPPVRTDPREKYAKTIFVSNGFQTNGFLNKNSTKEFCVNLLTGVLEKPAMGWRAPVRSDTGALLGASSCKRKHPRGAGSLPTRACRLHERRRNSARPEVEPDGASRRPRLETFSACFCLFI